MICEPCAYFVPRYREGRVTRLTFAISGFSHGLTFRTAGSFATAGMVGTLLLKIASYRSTAGLVRYLTSSTAASGCFEKLDTPSCQPPTVPTGAFAPVRGSVVTSNLPLTGPVWPIAYAYGQLRMNAALPAVKACSASPSW